MPSRPVVILAGWLGCQPRSLRKYEALYKQLGLQVVIRIATPRMVVEASHSSPYQQDPLPGSIQSLAWEIHGITDKNPCWFFHGFSNGGSFLWEQLRTIAQHTGGTRPVGVIFDSSPANYYNHDNLSKAVSYCAWSERTHLFLKKLWGGSKMTQERQQRALQFWTRLRQDTWNVRQLYLCSRDDDLTPFEDLKELVDERKGIHGEDRIMLRVWQSSPRCAHLLFHPVEYREAARPSFCRVLFT